MMNTVKARFFAFFSGMVLLGLGGCDEAQLRGFSAPKTAASLADGKVIAAAPKGYCFDPLRTETTASISHTVIARCDRLRQQSTVSVSQSLAVMSVTVIPQPPGTGPMKAEKIEAAMSTGKVTQRSDRPDIALLQFTEPAPIPGFSPKTWRGAFRVNGQIVGVTLIAPNGSDALGKDGADLLEQFAKETRRASKGQN